jgi:hypothetical protein
MDFFFFLTVCVVFGVLGGAWREYLKHQRASGSDAGDAGRIEALEQQVAQLESEKPTTEMEEQVRVLEAIVVDQDHQLESDLAALEIEG